MPIENNKYGHTVTVRGTGNTTVTVAGNNSTSNIAVVGETVIGASVTKIIWTTDAGITVKRGANTIFVMPAGSTDQFDLRDLNMPIEQDPSATLVITTAAAANCSFFIELTKQV